MTQQIFIIMAVSDQNYYRRNLIAFEKKDTARCWMHRFKKIQKKWDENNNALPVDRFMKRNNVVKYDPEWTPNTFYHLVELTYRPDNKEPRRPSKRNRNPASGRYDNSAK